MLNFALKIFLAGDEEASAGWSDVFKNASDAFPRSKYSHHATSNLDDASKPMQRASACEEHASARCGKHLNALKKDGSAESTE